MIIGEAEKISRDSCEFLSDQKRSMSPKSIITKP